MGMTSMVRENPLLKTSHNICIKGHNSDVRVESACVLRRAELNHRDLEDGQSPWSIRQTGVYLKLSVPVDPVGAPLVHPMSPSEQSNSIFVLIAPSSNFEEQLSQSLELRMLDPRTTGPWNIYRILVVDSLSGWMDYIAWLEEGLKEQVSLNRA